MKKFVVEKLVTLRSSFIAETEEQAVKMANESKYEDWKCVNFSATNSDIYKVGVIEIEDKS